MTRGRIAWTLAILAIVVYVITVVVDPLAEGESTVLMGVVMISFLAVGAALVTRVPGNRIGTLILIAGILVAVTAVATACGDLGTSQVPISPVPALGSIVANATLNLTILIALIGVPLIFPDGRLPSPRFRWIVRVAVVLLIGASLSYGFKTPTVGIRDLENPFVIAALLPALDTFDKLVSLASIVLFGGAVAAIWVRYHRGTALVRQQTKWLVAVAGVAAVAFPSSFVISNVTGDEPPIPLFFIGVLALAALPWAVAVAVLRYRLYDIDRIVSRTIAYAVVTGILAVVFTGAILLLSSVLSNVAQGQTVAVAASTLVVFALFQPIRRRVQGIVDRRFDRARYDGARTATAFAERLRNETDMETVTTDLASTTIRTVAPASLGIWLRTKASAR